MENWILVVGYDRPHFEAARKDWLRFNVYLHSVDTATEAIEQERDIGTVLLTSVT